MRRGMLTTEIKDLFEKLFDEDATKVKIRLLPYLMYVMVNSQKLDPEKINREERTILRSWKEKGYVSGGIAGMAITKEFWDKAQEVIFWSYVGYESQDMINDESKTA